MPNRNFSVFGLVAPVFRKSPRTFERRTNACRLAFIASLALLGMAASPVNALDYRLPHDPIGPKSQEECRALYAGYRAIYNRIRAEAKAEGDAAWALFEQYKSGQLRILAFQERSNPHKHREKQLRERASDVLSQGIRAKNRCMTQVRNRLRQEQRRRQDERTRIRIGTSGSRSDSGFANTAAVLDGLPGHAGYHALRGAGLAGLQAFRRTGRRYAVGGEMFRLPTNGRATSVAETLFRIAEVGSAALGSRTSDRSAFPPAGAAFGLEAVDRFTRWNRLQQVLFRASVGLLLNIQSAASADLDAAFAAFDRDFKLRKLERRMSTYSGVETTRYQAALRGAPGDGLAADLSRWMEEIDDMRNARAAPAARQFADEERRRRQAAEDRRRKREQAAEQQQRAAARKPRSGTDGYSATQCRQILTNIELAAQAIAGMRGATELQGALRDLQVVRDSSQTEYDRHCR